MMLLLNLLVQLNGNSTSHLIMRRISIYVFIIIYLLNFHRSEKFT